MNVYGYTFTKIIKKKEKVVHFQWITDIELTKRNLEEMIRTGRGRWKIEN